MDNLYVLRKKLQEIYAGHSIIFDKVAQFLLAMTVFYFINNKISLKEKISTSVILLILILSIGFNYFNYRCINCGKTWVRTRHGQGSSIR